MAEEKITRRPYKGSCHCGKIKYIAHLSFPPSLDPNAKGSAGTRIRKCNCSTCHKLSFFHVRMQDSPNDFMLLSPSGPEECAIYRCFEANVSWCFCSTCSVMVFAYWSEEGSAGEHIDAEVDGEKRQVWKVKGDNWKDGKSWIEGENAYLSVNAVTLEPDQEGLDLREWHENGWINYLDTKNEKDPNHFGRPSQGGMY